MRYVICIADNGGCFVQARFADIEACNGDQNFGSMLCDSVSVPGQTTCTAVPKDGDSIAAGQCVK